MEKALVTGADRGLGLAFTDLLLQEGWEVFAGQYMPENRPLRSLPVNSRTDFTSFRWMSRATSLLTARWQPFPV